MIHLLPGDLATVILGTGNTPANRKLLYAQLGLDKGLVQQYLTWAGHVLQGDLGTSFVSGESINKTLGRAIPIDVEMIILSQCLAFAGDEGCQKAKWSVRPREQWCYLHSLKCAVVHYRGVPGPTHSNQGANT